MLSSGTFAFAIPSVHNFYPLDITIIPSLDKIFPTGKVLHNHDFKNYRGGGGAKMVED